MTNFDLQQHKPSSSVMWSSCSFLVDRREVSQGLCALREMLSEASYPRKSLRHLVAYRNMAGTAWKFAVDGSDSGCRGFRPDFSSCSRLSNAQDEESRPISLGEIGKCFQIHLFVFKLIYV